MRVRCYSEHEPDHFILRCTNAEIHGGIRVNVVKDTLKAGADILVVGRAITASKDIHHAAQAIIEQLDREEIDRFRVMTDF